MNLYTAVVLIGLGTTVVQAATLDVKLGLWEVTTTTKSNGMPPMDLSKLTPEQRARVEAKLREMQSAKPETRTEKHCLTKEDLERSDFLGKKDDPSCKREVTSTTRTLSIKEVCSGDQKTSSDVRFEATSRESVKGTMEMKVGEGARSMVVNATFAAKYLGPACGNVK
jgi:hypothetical protein